MLSDQLHDDKHFIKHFDNLNVDMPYVICMVVFALALKNYQTTARFKSKIFPWSYQLIFSKSATMEAVAGTDPRQLDRDRT